MKSALAASGCRSVVLVACGGSDDDKRPPRSITWPCRDAKLDTRSVDYKCENGRKFTVQYLNKGDNSLAVVPVSDNSTLVFSNVISASGAVRRRPVHLVDQGRGSHPLRRLEGRRAHRRGRLQGALSSTWRLSRNEGTRPRPGFFWPAFPLGKGVCWQPVGPPCRPMLIISNAVHLPDHEIELNAIRAQAPAGRTSTRSPARCTCASTSRPRRCRRSARSVCWH